MRHITPPAGWSAKPLWSMFERVKDTGHPQETMLSVFREHGVVEKDSRGNLNVTADDRSIYQLVDTGWLVVNRMKAWQGSVGISQYRGIISGHYLCFRPRHQESSRYLNWLLRSSPYTAEYSRLSRGVRPGQAEIDNDQLRRLPVLIPPLAEQERIADFLDKQVMLLDGAIALRQRQQALNLERFSAWLEHHLVVRQGQQPRRPLAWLTNPARPIQYGIVLPGLPVEDGVPIIKGGDVAAGRLRPEALQRTTREIDAKYSRSRVREGDLVISIRGSFGELGKVPEALNGANLTQDSARIAPLGSDLDWLQAVLETPDLQSQMAQRATGAMVKGLNIFALRRLQVPTPDPETQARLGQQVTQRRSHVQDLDRNLDRSLALIRERKHALINAAVTGQIDVATARGVS